MSSNPGRENVIDEIGRPTRYARSGVVEDSWSMPGQKATSSLVTDDTCPE